MSVVLPCVLPLVPGYLAALSSVEAGQLGQRGTARRVVVSSIPFILGFTVVFVVLGAGAAAVGSVLSAPARTQLAGFILVVLGLAFVGLLPVPDRVLAPGLLAGARRRGSGALLGGAFAVCAAPCIGSVLGAVLVLASTSGTVLKGTVLLAAYALGLGAAFLVAGLAFARAMGAFRWLRDRYNADPGRRAGSCSSRSACSSSSTASGGSRSRVNRALDRPRPLEALTLARPALPRTDCY